MLDRRTHRASFGTRTSGSVPRHHRLAGRRARRPLLRSEFPAPSDVHGGEVCAAIVSGLVGPDAPDDERWETLWHYMQAARASQRHLYFYKLDGDIRVALPKSTRAAARCFCCPANTTIPAHRRKRLALRTAFPQRSHHHEGPRSFSDEREPEGVSKTCCRCWRRLEAMILRRRYPERNCSAAFMSARSVFKRKPAPDLIRGGDRSASRKPSNQHPESRFDPIET